MALAPLGGMWYGGRNEPYEVWMIRLAWLLMLAAFPALAAQPDVSAAIANATVSVSGTLAVHITSVPLPVINPASASIPCNLAPGTKIADVTATGGNGGPVGLTSTDPGSSFVLTGTPGTLGVPPPSTVVVGPAGVAVGLCPVAGAAPTLDTVTINANQ